MKLPFPIPTDNAKHEFCANCYTDNVQTVKVTGLTGYYCAKCNQTNKRRIVTGGMKLWLDDSGEIRHESAGVFVRDPSGKYLFFELTTFPFGFTVPAGHVDKGESAKQATIRELNEEVGIQASQLTELATCEIAGDKCSSGADTHTWHVYVCQLDKPLKVVKCEEGKDPQ